MAFKALKSLKINDDEPEYSCDDEQEDMSEDDSEGEVVSYFTRRYRKGFINSR